jgi:tyrosine-specific transport protein
MSQQNTGSLFGGTLLVAGTSVGGGMLALPVLTSAGGFVPSVLIFICCWLFMASTGLLFLELSLVMEKDANIVSMAKHTLGKIGAGFAWVVYLFLFYCLTLAYIVGCSNLFTDLFNGLIPPWLSPMLVVGFLGPIIFAGARIVGRLNVFLMLGLAISFIAFVVVGFQFIDPVQLAHRNWSMSLMALPIAFISFAYQGIIPTLVNYMHHDAGKTRMAILLGSSLPLVLYIVWQGLILGIVPLEGPHGLAEALANGHNAVHPLKYFVNNASVYTIAAYFAFFALVTSFFGVTLGLMDFLADGLHIRKDLSGKTILCLLTFIPPLAVSYLYPNAFLTALDYAGGIGSATLLGILPILMVWSLRYRIGVRSLYRLPGGKSYLLLLLAFVLFELTWELNKIFSSS